LMRHAHLTGDVRPDHAPCNRSAARMRRSSIAL
jgi:hypothetical protein